MDKFKNIVTNILGLIFWGFSVKELTLDETNYSYTIFLLVVGAILFRYKFSETKVIINNIIGRKNGSLKANFTVDPEIPEKPDTRG